MDIYQKIGLVTSKSTITCLKKLQSMKYAKKKLFFVIKQYVDLFKDTIEELGLANNRMWNFNSTSFCNDSSNTKMVGE